MSYLAGLVTKALIEELENEFLGHSTEELQKDFVNQIAIVSNGLLNWVESKLNKPTEGESK